MATINPSQYTCTIHNHLHTTMQEECCGSSSVRSSQEAHKTAHPRHHVHLLPILAIKRRQANNHLVRHATQGPPVHRPPIGCLQQHFWREILGGAAERARCVVRSPETRFRREDRKNTHSILSLTLKSHCKETHINTQKSHGKTLTDTKTETCEQRTAVQIR